MIIKFKLKIKILILMYKNQSIMIKIMMINNKLKKISLNHKVNKISIKIIKFQIFNYQKSKNKFS